AGLVHVFARGDDIAGFDKRRIVAFATRKNSAGPLTELVNVKLVVGEQHKVLKIAGCRRRVMLKPVQGVIDPWRRERSQGFGLTAPAPPCAIHDSVVSQS